MQNLRLLWWLNYGTRNKVIKANTQEETDIDTVDKQ